MYAYNPTQKEHSELDVIYGFINGSASGYYQACLIHQNGFAVGSRIVALVHSAPSELGIDGKNKDINDSLEEIYPQGYRMEFIEQDRIDECAGLLAAFEKNKKMQEHAEQEAARIEKLINGEDADEL
jgi:hypothetical protein